MAYRCGKPTEHQRPFPLSNVSLINFCKQDRIIWCAAHTFGLKQGNEWTLAAHFTLQTTAWQQDYTWHRCKARRNELWMQTACNICLGRCLVREKQGDFFVSMCEHAPLIKISTISRCIKFHLSFCFSSWRRAGMYAQKWLMHAMAIVTNISHSLQKAEKLCSAI